MKMKLKEVVEHYNGLTMGGAEGAALLHKKFPVKLSFGISKNIKKLEREVEDYQKARIKICENLSNKDDEGKPSMIMKEDGTEVYDISDRELLNEEIEELLDTEVDIDIHMVEEAVLDQCSESERYDIPSARELMIIDFMLT